MRQLGLDGFPLLLLAGRGTRFVEVGPGVGVAGRGGGACKCAPEAGAADVAVWSAGAKKLQSLSLED